MVTQRNKRRQARWSVTEHRGLRRRSPPRATANLSIGAIPRFTRSILQDFPHLMRRGRVAALSTGHGDAKKQASPGALVGDRTPRLTPQVSAARNCKFVDRRYPALHQIYTPGLSTFDEARPSGSALHRPW